LKAKCIYREVEQIAPVGKAYQVEQIAPVGKAYQVEQIALDEYGF
jgi:hypothetical protein